ncbi:carbohydrate ABC transporter permease [Cohnella fermenti]|uniref:Sugar ABC transporter permease n=1 Tax=Cohnella fermenti TaxID=2565925 RepID=A0A4S4C408_9BACL|nr:sugar ABC transporter permease [Cohnella fermenti]THF82263.1 sugar ABC transporter permease [Cohnella fermenti]
MGPALVMYVIIVVMPFALSLYYSMTDWNGIASHVGWVGLTNYKTILTGDPEFAKAFWFSTQITIVITVLTNVFGFALAYLLTKQLRFRNWWRTIYFMPNVLGGLLLGFIWQFIFTKGFASFGQLTGLSFFELPWLGSEATAFWALVIVSVWQGVGYVMVIYIAGMTAISKEMEEAADIDGAGELTKLLRIKLPMLMSSITVCLFLTISWTYKMYDLNLSLTKGGPFKSSESVAFNIFVEAFSNNNYSLGTAKAVLFFLAVVLITCIQVYITKKREVEL